jgi:hypothetical protein
MRHYRVVGLASEVLEEADCMALRVASTDYSDADNAVVVGEVHRALLLIKRLAAAVSEIDGDLERLESRGD